MLIAQRGEVGINALQDFVHVQAAVVLNIARGDVVLALPALDEVLGFFQGETNPRTEPVFGFSIRCDEHQVIQMAIVDPGNWTAD